MTRSSLTEHDRAIIAPARELARLRTAESVSERFPGWDQPGVAYAGAFGVARYLLAAVRVSRATPASSVKSMRSWASCHGTGARRAGQR